MVIVPMDGVAQQRKGDINTFLGRQVGLSPAARSAVAFPLPFEDRIPIIDTSVRHVALHISITIECGNKGGVLHRTLALGRGSSVLRQRIQIEATVDGGDIIRATQTAQHTAGIQPSRDRTCAVTAKWGGGHVDLTGNTAHIGGAGNISDIIATGNNGVILGLAHNAAD